jgi:D-sedoheptulose 7-phosphate isomerase
VSLDQHVVRHFETSIDLQQRSMALLPSVIAEASTVLVGCLLNGNKILCCGVGGSAASAQRVAAELVNRYEHERPGLPALALAADGILLTAVAADAGFKQALARQTRALGQSGDVLLVLASAGGSAALLEAMRAAHDRGMQVILLTGQDDDKLIQSLGPADIVISVPGKKQAHLLEVHDVILHCLCHLIDIQLFGGS